MGKNNKRVTEQPKVIEVNHESASQMHKIFGKKLKLKCKNKRQKDFVKLISEKEITLAAGPAGTGKSYLSIFKALELVQNKTSKYEKVKILKPAVEVEEKVGFLPGDLNEKLQPYLESSMDIVDKICGEQNRVKLMESGILAIEPLGFIRGKTIDNTVLIVEEAQNISPNQMKSLLTRIGENTKFIISGDLDQSDKFKVLTKTGLYDVFKRISVMDEIGTFIFEKEDIVRNPIIGKILNYYHTDGNFIDTDIFNKKDNK